MKLIKLLGGSLAACAIVSTAQAGQWTEGSIAGFDHAFTYVPDTYAPRAADGSTDKRSLVIHLVGCGQVAEQAKTAGGWEMAAEAYGMIVVIPDPMKAVHPNKAATKVECFDYGYNSEFSMKTLPTKSYKDHAAIIAAPAKMQQVYSEIDLDQVYVTGLSAGAAVAMEVACMAPDVFAGVGEAAGPAWDTRQQQAVAAVNGGGMVSKQTDPASMKSVCEGWAGSNKAKMKEQVWAIVSDDNFLPIGGLGQDEWMNYTFTIFNDGSVWDGDKFTPTAYHRFVTEVMEDLILDGSGTKTEEVLTSSEEHGQGSGCSAEAANFEWEGLTDGAYGVDYSSVQCLPKDYVRRDWEAKAEIWKSSTGHKQLVRIQQDTLKHSWPIGSENRANFMECIGPNGMNADITVDQIYNPENANYSYMKDSDGMWKAAVVKDLPNGAIGCIYFNPVSINFPMYLGKLWNNNNPKLGAAIEDGQCEDLNNNGICDKDEEPCEDLNNNGICDIDEEPCEDLNNNGICDKDEDPDDKEPELSPLQISIEADLTVVIQGKVTIGDAELTSATLDIAATSGGAAYGPFALDVEADGTYIIALGGLPEATYTATVNVIDANDATDSEEKTFTVGEIDNVAPVVATIKATANEECVTFSGTATDADGSVVGVDLRIKGIGTKAATVSGSSFSYDLCDLEAGTYSATAIATDNGGLQSEKSAVATATIEGSDDGGEAESFTGTFYEHWSAGRITGSMWAPTAQYTELKNKHCATSWFTMFCTTAITLNKCPDDTEWTESAVTCGGGVVAKKADIATQGGDLGTVNANTSFVIQPTVVNNGPDAAGAVSLEIAIPAGITVNAAAINGDCEVTTGAIECALGTIANGASKSIAIPATSSVNGGYIIALSATTAQKDENGSNDASEISLIVGKIEVDEEAPVVSSIVLTPANEVEEGETVKVTVAVTDNKGVTSGSVNSVSGSSLCTLALKSGTNTNGTFECSFTAPQVDADAMLSVDATVADAAGNVAESGLAQITVKNAENIWVSPAAYSDFGGSSWVNTPNPDWYKADKSASNYTDYYAANKDKNLSDLNMYLHVPAGLEKDPAIVIVMHGCNQAGYQTQGGHAKSYNNDTDWTGFADKHKFIAVFPEVVQRATMSDSTGSGGNKFRINGDFSCFGWGGFYGLGLNREEGDAKTIMNMVDWVKAKYDLDDDSKIYATGFSAGGGMAAALAAIYPDKIAGVSTNAGLGAFVATAGVPVDSIALNSNGSPKNPGESHPIVMEIQYTMGATTGFDPNSVGCQKSSSGEACMHQDYYNRTAQELGDFAREYGLQGYTGSYPKVIAFQGMSDQFVDDRNAELIARQFTNLHGVDMVADGAGSINGTSKHAYKEYQNAAGEAVVATVEVPSMCHAVVVDPGTAANQGGKSTQGLGGCSKFSKYSTDGDVYHVYESAKFWGLVD